MDLPNQFSTNLNETNSIDVQNNPLCQVFWTAIPRLFKKNDTILLQLSCKGGASPSFGTLQVSP